MEAARSEIERRMRNNVNMMAMTDDWKGAMKVVNTHMSAVLLIKYVGGLERAIGDSAMHETVDGLMALSNTLHDNTVRIIDGLTRYYECVMVESSDVMNSVTGMIKKASVSGILNGMKEVNKSDMCFAIKRSIFGKIKSWALTTSKVDEWNKQMFLKWFGEEILHASYFNEINMECCMHESEP